MEIERSARGEAGVFVAATLASSALFVFAATRPIEWLVRVVPDDAFYYLQIARHLARTGASTFDGINPTNGYHPAWMGIMAICAKIFTTPMALVRACVLTCFLFHLGAGLCLARALRSWMAGPLAWAGGALWIVNPLALALAIQGMEASVYVFALSLALLTYARRIHPASDGRAPSLGDLVLFGLSLSFCFLGRTEAVILSGVALLGVALAFRRAGIGFLRVLPAAGAAAVGTLPWFLYSRAATGQWFQNSGAMKMLWAGAVAPHGLKRAWGAVRFLFGQWASYPLLELSPWGAVRGAGGMAMTGLVIWALRRGLARPELRRTALVGSFLFAATLLTGATYALFFTDTQFWYRAQPGFLLFVIVFVAAVFLLRVRGWDVARVGRALAGVTFLAVLISGARFATLKSYPWQRDVLLSQRQFDQLVPADARIGCFNAGIPGFFSDRLIINLDGLVNNALFPYYRDHRFDRYLADAGIQYIADEIDALHRASVFAIRPPELTVVATAPLTDWSSPTRYLWRLDRR